MLDLSIEPDETVKSMKGRQTKTLSGGEKSFSSVCLLLSLWEAMGAPLRCLDEFDVFMDQVNRDVSTKMIVCGVWPQAPDSLLTNTTDYSCPTIGWQAIYPDYAQLNRWRRGARRRCENYQVSSSIIRAKSRDSKIYTNNLQTCWSKAETISRPLICGWSCSMNRGVRFWS